MGWLAQFCKWWIGGRGLAIWLSILFSTILGCSPSVETPHVNIEHEVFLEKDQGCGAQGITPTRDGGVVLVGTILEACATRVSAQGKILWRYVEPHDSTFGEPYRSQSSFGGAVVLADDSVVLCGGKDTSEGQLGFVVRINSHGEVLDRETLAPKGGAPWHQSRFDECVPWDGGAALLGAVPHAPRADGWLVKLDGVGRKVWEMAGQDYGGSDALELADHGLIMGETISGPLTLVRVNPDGSLQRKRIIPCGKALTCFFNLFHRLTPSPDLRLVSADWPHATIHHLDGALNDLDKPVPSRATVRTNRAFQLGDGGGVLFGGESAAFIAYVARTGQLSTIYAWRPTWSQNHLEVVEESVTVNDAAGMSDTEFVSVREWVGHTRAGMYVDWMSIR